MGKFLTSLILQETTDGKCGELVRPLSYESDTLGDIVVPVGFASDYASVPWRTARGKYNRAAWVHDWLYSKDCPLKCTRKVADAVFYEAMRACDVNRPQAFAYWLGVRLGGWAHWKD